MVSSLESEGWTALDQETEDQRENVGPAVYWLFDHFFPRHEANTIYLVY